MQQQVMHIPKIFVIISSLLFIIFILIFSLYPFVPLTYDEAWNFNNISSRDTLQIPFKYLVPNNHVFFTLLQSLLLPYDLVVFHPPHLRLLNILYICAAIATTHRIVRKNSQSLVLMVWAVAFASPLLTTYLFVSRGYMLGFLFLLFSSHLLIYGRYILSSFAAALSAYTVPTFALYYPAFILYIIINERVRGLNNLFNRLTISIGSYLSVVGILYFPILKEVLAVSSRWKPYADLLTFLADLSANSSFLSVALSPWFGGVFLMFIATAVLHSYKRVRKNIFTLQDSVVLLFGLLSLAPLVVIMLSLLFGAAYFPYIRSLGAMFGFATIAISVACCGEVLPRFFSRFVLILILFNTIFGVSSVCSSFLFGNVLDFPHFAELSPTPIERVTRRGFNLSGLNVSVNISAEPVSRLYGASYGFNINLVDFQNTDVKCVIGNIRPSLDGLIFIEENGSVLSALCY